RAAPLGIHAARDGVDDIFAWNSAQEDAELTHPHPLCVAINAVYVAALAWTIRQPLGGDATPGRLAPAVHEYMIEQARRPWVDSASREAILAVLDAATSGPPASYSHQSGWVLTAFHNAAYQLLHAPT